jgi:E3 SUMO-protein ligase PIAS1
MTCRYVKDILKNTSDSLDQVTIQPDGKWEMHVKKETSSRPSYGANSDSDDEIVEITNLSNGIQMGAPKKTPVTNTIRESSSSSSLNRQSSTGLGSSNGKRPAAVIDLTSSGDEDDDPIPTRPAKRQYQPNGFAASVPTYRPPPPTGFSPRS